MPQPLIDGEADLFLPFAFHGRTVNAPELAFAIPLESFENETRRHTVTHASLDYVCGLEMTNQAPDGAHEARISVVPSFEARWTGLNPLCIEFPEHLGPQGPEFLCHRLVV